MSITFEIIAAKKKVTISPFIIRATKNFKDFFSFRPLINCIVPNTPNIDAIKTGRPTNNPELAYSVPLANRTAIIAIKIKPQVTKLFLKDLLV